MFHWKKITEMKRFDITGVDLNEIQQLTFMKVLSMAALIAVSFWINYAVLWFKGRKVSSLLKMQMLLFAGGWQHSKKQLPMLYLPPPPHCWLCHSTSAASESPQLLKQTCVSWVLYIAQFSTCLVNQVSTIIQISPIEGTLLLSVLETIIAL